VFRLQVIVSTSIFCELAQLLDQVVMLLEPIHVTGDFNVRLERADDVNASRLIDLFTVIPDKLSQLV